MANTKRLLETGSIDDVLKSVEVTQRTFTPKPTPENPSPHEITYNQLVLNFENGDEFTFTSIPAELKSAI